MDLKVRRIRAKVTQEQIAKHVGLSRSWVAKIERVPDDLPVATVTKYDNALRTFLDVSEVA
jgi:transcriptional regulator with XRE-family HTH domain